MAIFKKWIVIISYPLVAWAAFETGRLDAKVEHIENELPKLEAKLSDMESTLSVPSEPVSSMSLSQEGDPESGM